MKASPAFALALALLAAVPAAAAPKPPNVLLVVTDDQGYGDLSGHGNPHLKTPTLDKLAAESVRFDRFFVSPLCAPTRASLLTGRYSLRTGTHGVASGTETMRSEEVTIAEALKAAGYRTGLFGKWHNGEHYPHTANGQGFDESFGHNLGHWNNYFDTALKRNGKWEKTTGYITDVETDEALKFIDRNAANPFFCYVALTTPHSPFQVPDAYFDRYKKAGLDDRLACIYAMCANIDDNVARLLKKLDDLKLRDDTVVLFLTDNGPNGARFNGGMRGTKGTYHEGGSRVPLFVRYPARLKEPRLVKPIAMHIDLFPTLIELCGVPMPKTLPLDGKSLVPLLEGKADGWPDRTLFTQHLLAPKAKGGGAAVRTQKWRLVRTGAKWELFDMAADPGQEKDVSAAHPDVVRELSAAYEAWFADARKGAEGGRPPIPVGYDQENPVDLPAPQSKFSGGPNLGGKAPNNGWLAGWDKPGAKAEWELDVVKPGEYAVSLLYLCAEKSAGGRVAVRAGESKCEAVLKCTPVVRLPSPDRSPRESESYEMEWHTLPVGAVTLGNGRATLGLELLAAPNGPALELKSVILTRK